jgi:hypothetical protein
VQASRHQVVHQIVAAGDLVEDLVDQRLLLAGADASEAVGGLHLGGRRGSLF